MNLARSSTIWDAVIVGGGPGGAATAMLLARSGRRVLVLERQQFPRRKPCGDCVNPAALAVIRRIGAEDRLLRMPHVVLRGWRIRPVRGEPFDGRFPAGVFGIAIRRELLDGALLTQAAEAGAEVRLGCRVLDLVRDHGRVSGVRVSVDGGSREIRAKVVIGADGLRSVVSRRAGLVARAPKVRKLAITGRVDGVDLGGVDLDGAGELRVERWGCIGIAPVGDGFINVTVVVKGDGGTVAGKRDAHFDEVVRRLPGFSEATRHASTMATGPFDWPTRSAVGDGVALVGDAAGYFDPFTGQGIYRALRGAELLAPVVDAALRNGGATADALAPYHGAIRREFRPGERLQHLIEGVVSRPFAIDTAARWLRLRPVIADALVAVTGDLAPLRSMVRPILGIS